MRKGELIELVVKTSRSRATQIVAITAAATALAVLAYYLVSLSHTREFVTNTAISTTTASTPFETLLTKYSSQPNFMIRTVDVNTIVN